MEEATVEEREGMKMIQFLQKMVEIKESDESALRGWRRMAEWERESTRKAYSVLHG